jgi:hypothetical protein
LHERRCQRQIDVDGDAPLGSGEVSVDDSGELGYCGRILDHFVEADL